MPINMTKFIFFDENPVNHKICQVATRRLVPDLGLSFGGEVVNGPHNVTVGRTLR